MAYTFHAPNPDLEKEVDFDFFDSPRGRESPTNLGNSGKWKGFKSSSAANTEEKGERSSQTHGSKGKDKPPRKESNRSEDDISDGSYSTDYSSTTSGSSKQSHVKKIEAKIPRVDSESRPHTDDENRQTGKCKSAENKEDHVSRSRASVQKGSRRLRSYSSDSDQSFSSTDSYTSTDTDSDVTDVSPLHSPDTSPTRQSHTDSKPPVSPMHKEVTFKRPPSSKGSGGRSGRSLTRANSDDIDLRLLMQAVMEMEQNCDPKLTSLESRKHQQMFTMPRRNPTSVNRKNFSFSNEDVRVIDHENQRLMQQIMRYTIKSKKKKKLQKQSQRMQTSPNRMSSSAINRNREQMRIERENFALLQRLNAAKATRELARENLIKDYQSQMLFGCSVAAAHPVEKKKKSPYTVTFNPRFTSGNELSDRPCSGKRTRPASAVVHGSRPMSGKIRAARPISATVTHANRPLSAGSMNRRPLSAKVVGTLTKEASPGHHSRPAWEDKW